MALDIEIWRGARRLRPYNYRHDDGALMEDEPDLERLHVTTCPSEETTRIGRQPGYLEPGEKPPERPVNLVEFADGDPQISRVALSIEPAQGRSGWVLECRNRRGAEVGIWAYAHRTAMSHGHWCSVLGGQAAVLLRSADWLYWVLLSLPTLPKSDLIDEAIDKAAAADVRADIEGLKDRPTDSDQPRQPPPITDAQGLAFRDIYRDILRWPPTLHARPSAHSQVQRKAGERLKRIQTWAMTEGFLAAAGPSAFSPALPQFLADNAVITFNRWHFRPPDAPPR